MSRDFEKDEIEPLPLSKAATNLVEECRMILPGIQALFGFQLIAVFNAGFDEKLSQGEQRLHLLATTLIAVAVALIMTPAAYHRQTAPRDVTRAFLDISTRLMLWTMFPLTAGICLDFYLVARLIVGVMAGAFLSVLLAGWFAYFWFVLPWSHRRS